MKAYGIQHNKDVESADCADIRLYGLKYSTRRKKGGDIKNSFRSSKSKHTTCHIWKKELVQEQ